MVYPTFSDKPKCLLAAKTASQLASKIDSKHPTMLSRDLTCRILPCFDQFLSCFDQGKAEAHEKRIWLPHQKPGSGRSPFRMDESLLVLTDTLPNRSMVMGLVHMPQDKNATFGMFWLFWYGSCPCSGPKPTIISLLQREVLRFLRPLLEWVQSVQSKKSQICATVP